MPKATVPKHTRTPALPIMLDRERHIRFNLSALARLDRALGGNGVDAVSERLKTIGLTASDMLVLLWAGLTPHDPELTQETVGDWVDVANIAHVGKVIAAAWCGAKTPAADPPDAALPTGEPAGR